MVTWNTPHSILDVLVHFFVVNTRMPGTRSFMNNNSLFLTFLDVGNPKDLVPASGEGGPLTVSHSDERNHVFGSTAEVLLLLGGCSYGN